jgi:hypothetical protein
MLYLSRPRRKKNRLTASPFVLDVAAGEPPLASEQALPPPFVPNESEDAEPPMFSFSEVAS